MRCDKTEAPLWRNEQEMKILINGPNDKIRQKIISKAFVDYNVVYAFW